MVMIYYDLHHKQKKIKLFLIRQIFELLSLSGAGTVMACPELCAELVGIDS